MPADDESSLGPAQGAFKAWTRPKPRVVNLLEAATDVHRRVAALRALDAFRMPTSGERRQRFLDAIAMSLDVAPQVGRATDAHVCTEPRPTTAELRQTQVKVPFIYVPAESTASTSARGPWEGCRDRLRFSVVGGGQSALVEAACAAGLRRSQRATGQGQGAGGECDPQDVPWAHVMIARMSVDRDSPVVRDTGVRFDTAGVTMRALLAVAAQRPWCCVFDFAPTFRSAQEGAGWRLFEGVLHELGYVVDSVVLCPSVCLEATWAGAREPAHGCQGT